MSGLRNGMMAAALVAGVSACSAPLEWQKPGVSATDNAADVSYCDGARQQVAAYTPDDEMHWVRLYEIDAYNDCMAARGYHLVDPGSVSQTGAASAPAQGANR